MCSGSQPRGQLAEVCRSTRDRAHATARVRSRASCRSVVPRSDRVSGPRGRLSRDRDLLPGDLSGVADLEVTHTLRRGPGGRRLRRFSSPNVQQPLRGNRRAKQGHEAERRHPDRPPPGRAAPSSGHDPAHCHDSVAGAHPGLQARRIHDLQEVGDVASSYSDWSHLPSPSPARDRPSPAPSGRCRGGAHPTPDGFVRAGSPGSRQSPTVSAVRRRFAQRLLPRIPLPVMLVRS